MLKVLVPPGRPASHTAPAWPDGPAQSSRRGLAGPLGRSEDDVRPQRGHLTCAQFIQETPAHSVTLLRAEGVDGGPVACPEHDLPEPVRMLQLVLARDRLDGGAWHASAREQVGQSRGGGDLIPRIESLEQRRLNLADAVPEMAVRWLEQAWAPGGDRHHAAR